MCVVRGTLRTDRLRKMAVTGLPSKPWVERAVRRLGIEIRWEEFRSLIDVLLRGIGQSPRS